MPDDTRRTALSSYENPVYPGSFPDPYILKFSGEYFAYCTGHWDDGRVFGVLRSRDLVNWEAVGGAMEPLTDPSPYYWAPEVTYHNGRFYLYYSVGNEVLMHLRVAVSERPDGGFTDAGMRLTNEEFAIDAHVFTDDDGTRYMFYATDFLEHTHIGTGTVVDKMLDWMTLAGSPRPVTRAKYDWQVYDPARKEKGGVRWHTVEGPFILKRKGLYYEMFSGGNWQNTTYGVSYAISDRIETPDEWQQHADGENVLPILRTIPPKVIGPGHNSVVRGPNNRELYCVYHSWTDHGRVLSIDRMDFAGERMFVHGPTTTAQPAPYRPSVERFDTGWTQEGQWDVTANNAASGAGECRMICAREFPDGFLCEVNIRGRRGCGEAGVVLLTDNASSYEFVLRGEGGAIFRSDGNEDEIQLSDEIEAGTFQTLRIEADRRILKILLNGIPVLEKTVADKIRTIGILSRDLEAEFAAIEITAGFEDLFEVDMPPPDLGWELSHGSARIENGEMVIEASGRVYASKGRAYDEYEYALNVRGEYGFAILAGTGDTAHVLEIDGRALSVDDELFELPDSFDRTVYHQFRFLVSGTKAIIFCDDTMAGEMRIDAQPTRIALVANGTVNVEMARLTVL